MLLSLRSRMALSGAPAASAKPRRVAATAPRRLVPGCVRVTCSSASGCEESTSFSSSSQRFFVPSLSVPNGPVARSGGGEMERNMGSGSMLGAVMERAKMNFVMPTPPQQGPKLEDGDNGGNIGKHNHNGGGGGDDGGDDDDFFNEEGDGEGEGEGEGQGGLFARLPLPEMYDKLSLGAVFAEWMKTIADMPLILRRAVEMGLFSSAQLVRFFSMDVRPNIVRSISRSLPPAWARDFVGRLMADPAFMQKLIIESAFASAASLWYEYRARGDSFKKELDLVLINTLGMAVATASTVWLVSPTRSFGNVHKYPWQQLLEQLPNCVFDASGPLRNYSAQMRAASFFTKAAELSAVGLLTGTLTSLLSSAVVSIRQKYDPAFQPSVPIPEVARSSAGMAAFFATSANMRYQLLGGLDRYLFGHANMLLTYMLASGAARLGAQAVGETHRPFFQGLPQPGPPAPRRRVVRRKVVKRRMVEVAAEGASGDAAALAAVGMAALGAAAESPAQAGGASTSAPAIALVSRPEPAVAFLDQALSAPASAGSSSADERVLLAQQQAGEASSISISPQHEQRLAELDLMGGGGMPVAAAAHAGQLIASTAEAPSAASLEQLQARAGQRELVGARQR